jgi:predicted ATPase
MALPITRIEAAPLGAAAVRTGEWPASLPGVATLLRDGLDLGPATVIVGENGTGKSTLMEGIAEAYGLPATGGTPRRGVQAKQSALAPALRIVRGRGATRHGVFLRSEAPEQGFGTAGLHGEISAGGRAHELSHGESFLTAIAGHRDQTGLVVLDEPESGLSFGSCLSLVAILADLVADGSQVLLATHSPVLAALPRATIVDLDEEGFHAVEWEDLDLVRNSRRFLADPQGYLRRLLG